MKKIIILIVLISSFAYGARIDLSKSVVRWKGSKIVGDSHNGEIPLLNAKLKNKKSLLGAVITLDVNRLKVSDLSGKSAGNFVGHMKSGDFFDTQKYPTAQIEITSVSKNTATGFLTIKGKKRKISFPVLKFFEKYIGNVTFDRTKFGLKYGSGSFFKGLGDKVISDDVEVEFELFVKK